MRHFIRGYFDGDGCITGWMSYEKGKSDRKRRICRTIPEKQEPARHHRQMASYLSGAHGNGEKRQHSKTPTHE